MYDPKGYSLWFCENRFKDGIEVGNSCFMSINFASFFNYMDVTRKYAFGRMLVIGSKPPYKLKGVWLFRGQEIPRFLLKRHQFRLTHDIRAYHWHKVDILDAAQTQRVTQMIMIQEQQTFEGEAVVDAKCFMWIWFNYFSFVYLTRPLIYKFVLYAVFYFQNLYFSSLNIKTE